MATITVLGTGYVGLVTAACFSKFGHQVIGYDIDENKIASLTKGHSPIYEPGLSEILTESLAAGNLKFTTDLAYAINSSEVLFVCVGTPQAEDGRADLSQIDAVARTIAAHMTSYKLIVEKSTVPVKTAQWLRRTIQMQRPNDVPFSVASNPEFLREGSAIHDVFSPDRIVIGVEDQRGQQILEELYAPFDCKKVIVDLETSEMIKHASNSFLATKISYINMVSELCDKVGADVTKVAEGMGLDTRIGGAFLNAGLGYGGSCFPKDVRAFTRMGEDHGASFDLLKVVDEINQNRVPYLLKRVNELCPNLSETRIAIWGLAFKPETDDIREAPSLRIVEALITEGAQVTAWDPEAQENFAASLTPETLANVTFASNPEEAAAGADLAILVTEWAQLQTMDLVQVANTMRKPIILDGRLFLDPQTCQEAGIAYYAIGRPNILGAQATQA